MAVINVLVSLMWYGWLSNENTVEKRHGGRSERGTNGGWGNYVSTLPTLETDLFSLKLQL